MGDNQDVSLSDIVESAARDMPLYEMSDALISKWEALPQQRKFTPVLPRLAWDRLYSTIELLNTNLLNSAQFSVEVVAASQTHDYGKMKQRLIELTSNTILVQNSLRQFQEILMQAAADETGSGIEDGR